MTPATPTAAAPEPRLTVAQRMLRSPVLAMRRTLADEDTIGDVTFVHFAWYLRQMLGSANLTGGRLFHLLSGNLQRTLRNHL
jgi:hypothetical protein